MTVFGLVVAKGRYAQQNPITYNIRSDRTPKRVCFSPLIRSNTRPKPFWKKPSVLALSAIVALGVASTAVYFACPKNDSSNAPTAAADFEAKSDDGRAASPRPRSRPPSRVRSAATTNGDFFDKCAPSVACDPNAQYRTYNGSCNNLQHPNWGSALTPFYRLMDAQFDDGNVYNHGETRPATNVNVSAGHKTR